MLTYPKSAMRVRRMPMHLSSGHVTLMPGKFCPSSNFPQSHLGRWADSRWALPQISSLFMFCYKFFCQREISEMRGPTGVKFCTMVITRPYFIRPVQNFWGHTPKKYRRSAYANAFEFGPRDFDAEEILSPFYPPMSPNRT